MQQNPFESEVFMSIVIFLGGSLLNSLFCFLRRVDGAPTLRSHKDR